MTNTTNELSHATALSLQTPQKGTHPTEYSAIPLSRLRCGAHDSAYPKIGKHIYVAIRSNETDSVILSDEAGDTSETSQAEQQEKEPSNAIKLTNTSIRIIKYTALTLTAFSVVIGFMVPGLPTAIVITLGFDIALPSFGSFIAGLGFSTLLLYVTEDFYPSIIALYKTAKGWYLSKDRSAFGFVAEFAYHKGCVNQCISQEYHAMMRQLQGYRQDLDVEKKKREEIEKKLETYRQDLNAEREERGKAKTKQDTLEQRLAELEKNFQSNITF
ncbi:MAG: hypothetical protein J3R72DRAFT_431776 [Linnemannia gamsii]|nr:MAG: hypothetical protein J3R72DRAFT_431776 [Linnemannia gamsii]